MTTDTWTSAASANWATPGDWSTGTPTSSQDIVIGSNAANTTVTTLTNYTVNSLNINSGDTLAIDAGTFTATNGAPNGIFGTVAVQDADFVVDNGTINNSGQLDLTSLTTTQTILYISGNVSLNGAGTIFLSVSGQGGNGSNQITGLTPSATFTNDDNLISGTGLIQGLNFINQGANGFGGTVETGSGGTLMLWGDAAGGGFNNENLLIAQTSGILILGKDTDQTNITNSGSIEIQNNVGGTHTYMEVAGNLTLQSGGGQILFQGTNGDGNNLVSDGQAATLNLDGGTLSGAGNLGDANLTLNINGALIEETTGALVINAGAMTINAAAKMEAANSGMIFVDDHINNNGTVDAISGGELFLVGSIVNQGNGFVEIGPNGLLSILSGGSVVGSVLFSGSGGVLKLSTGPTQVGAEIVGAGAGDGIDVGYVAFAAGEKAVWQQNGTTGTGVLALQVNGTTRTSLALQGVYTSANFTVVNDGAGNSLIEVTSVPVEYDLNADGVSDMVWRQNTGALIGWSMAGPSILSSQNLTSQGTAVTPDSSWSIAGIGDFNDNGDDADILWRQNTGALADWSMNGTAITSSQNLTSQGTAITPDSSWSVAGIGDFNGDNDADILWRQNTGALADWSMNGSAITSSQNLTSQGTAVTPDSSWSVAGIGDFNGDGNADILWRQSSTGTVADWSMNGSAITSSQSLTSQGTVIAPNSTWSVVGVGDFNGDGKADILWRQSTTGSLAEWLMNGSTITSSATPTFQGTAVSPDSTWNIVEVGQFNGSGDASIIWQQSTTGSLLEWQMNGATIQSSIALNSNGTAVAPPPGSWQTQERATDVS